jgi:hypothetical protein
MWSFKNNKGKFIQYDPKDNHKIEAAYHKVDKYMSYAMPFEYTSNVNGKEYTIDYDDMVQIDNSQNPPTQREIKRDDIIDVSSHVVSSRPSPTLSPTQSSRQSSRSLSVCKSSFPLYIWLIQNNKGEFIPMSNSETIESNFNNGQSLLKYQARGYRYTIQFQTGGAIQINNSTGTERLLKRQKL